MSAGTCDGADGRSASSAAQGPLRDLCLVYVTRTRAGAQEVLLGTKLRGFGAGLLVAPGGKVDDGESPRAAASRELREETGLVVAPEALVARGLVTFRFPPSVGPDLRTHVFVVDAEHASGDLVASDELDTGWVGVHGIPWQAMWPDARHWLPTALHRDVGTPTFWYAADGVSLERLEH